MPGYFWERWRSRPDMDTGPEAAEVARSSFAEFLFARHSSSSHFSLERRDHGHTVQAILGYNRYTEHHFEAFRNSLKQGFVAHDHVPVWVGDWSFRPFPDPQTWEVGQTLMTAGMKALPQKIWEFRYGFHPNAGEVEPAFGRILPNPELHQHTFGVLALSSDISRSSLIRFWLSPKELTGKELLPCITQDPLVLLHTRPLHETHENGFRILHFMTDRAGMIYDVTENDASTSPEKEAEILRSQVPPRTTICQIGKVKFLRKNWFVYSGCQAQMVTSTFTELQPAGVLAMTMR